MRFGPLVLVRRFAIALDNEPVVANVRFSEPQNCSRDVFLRRVDLEEEPLVFLVFEQVACKLAVRGCATGVPLNLNGPGALITLLDHTEELFKLVGALAPHMCNYPSAVFEASQTDANLFPVGRQRTKPFEHLLLR